MYEVSTPMQDEKEPLEILKICNIKQHKTKMSGENQREHFDIMIILIEYILCK